MKLIVEFEVNDNLGIGKFAKLINFAAMLGMKHKKSHTVKKYQFKRINDGNISVDKFYGDNANCIIKARRMVSSEEK